MGLTEQNGCVLIVDDSDIIRHSLKNFFEDYKFQVVTCNDGLEGIQKAIKHKPRVIFLDLLMPNLNGLKMLQVIKVMDELKDIPVIVISGNANKTNVLAAIEAGAERVISKPLKKTIIIRNVNEVLGEEFLQNAKKKNIISDEDNKELIAQLQNFFLKSFPSKGRVIRDALVRKNVERLRAFAHELKGTGSAIGYPNLTEISADIHERLSEAKVDWIYVEDKFNHIFKIVNEMEQNFQK